jgi:hypothetical protein
VVVVSGVSDSPLAPLEKLELMLPGFKGYKRKDLIRQDDVLVRQAIKMRLLNAQEELGLRESRLAAQNPFDPRISEYEEILSLLRGVSEEVGAAPAGMYTFYTRFKLFEEDMMKIVEYDLKLLTTADEVLKQARGDADPATLRQLISEIRVAFNDRQKLFSPEKIR